MRMRIMCNVSVLFMACASHASWTSTSEFECAVTNALLNESVLVDSGFTNALGSFVSNPVQSNLLAQAELAMSVCYQTIFDTLAENTLPEALLSASNCLSHSSPSDWTFWAAQLQLVSCNIVDANYQGAYTVASNAVATFDQTMFSDTSNIVSRAFLKNNNIEHLSFQEAFLFAKAISAAGIGRRSEALSMCAGLPPSCSNEVEEVLQDTTP